MASGSHDVTASNRHIPHAPPPHTLHDDLIMEILQWLPVKDLLQHCCVCKSWKSLISDPYFTKKQLRGSPMSGLILSFKNPSGEFVIQVYPSLNVSNVIFSATEYIVRNVDSIVGSCNGILCFVLQQRPELLVLWNPCVGGFKELPPLDNQQRGGSYTIYGFGYDSFSHTYKVVAGFFYKCDGAYKSEMKLLTLGTDTWNRIGEFPSVVPLEYESGKFVSGTVNWLASKSNDPDSWVIISLDLRRETYQEVLQPNYGQEPAEALTLHVFRDCLSIIPRTDLFIEVWLMKDYGKKESWIKLFRVPYVHNYGPYPYSNVLGISEDDQILLECNSDFVICNPRNGTLKYREIRNGNRFMSSEPYVESLISPCS